MKRVVLWLLSTLTALVLLFGYHTSTSATLAADKPAVSVHSTSESTTSDSSGSGGTTDTGSTDSGSTDSGASDTSSVTGDVVSTQWGPVQVQLEMSGTTITDVTVLQYPNSNGHDIQINNYALPILIQETLDAQSSDISMVSGATVTSQGYIGSLQSALDQVQA